MLFPLLLVSPCLAAGLAKRPQMGWNSWNAFKSHINESVILRTADALVSTGMRVAGYEYLLIDDGWADDRDANGYQQANASRFPNGIPAVADYTHERGLKLGIYSDAGIFGCSFRPGSWGYEEVDAATFASWGVDYLKYDNCGGFQAGTYPPQERFGRMANALRSSGREIFYSLCQWGNQFPWLWADQIGESYRISGDIYPSFSSDGAGTCKTAYCLNTGYASVSVLTMIRKMRELSYFQKPGAWADMDMLEIGNGVMTELEEQTHFSFWAALKSPLIASANLQTISRSSLDILLNEEIIAINQDDAGAAVEYVPALSTEGSTQVWVGPLSSGKSRFVILAFNEKNTTQSSIEIPLFKVPRFAEHVDGSGRVRDVWATRDFRQTDNNLVLEGFGPHETKVLVFSQ
ncbi:hypothetical protein DL766_007239 [Monosporascus sp. MC13-8B]|uniref:Alpha-galactosidase n=1 Tax=Monosporascus cannonballus TaxID=155416 RepID=A0ABY0HNJ5_9PEZI|nr:hypothetical protein DL763_005940 [Monosporascus cannonballus]RYO95085.1 hypothetical protein DL762_000278 [Monosporascus cannonballus]RYP24656.1 hypothetical protein DL766_007239 [Monosporascus sp. MC13-8B]